MAKLKKRLLKDEKEVIKLEKNLTKDNALKNKSFWLGILSLVLGIIFTQYPTFETISIILLCLAVAFFLIVILTYLWGILLKDNIKKDVDEIKVLSRKAKKK